MIPLETATEKLQERLIADRKVRALAVIGSYGTDAQWQGSVPTLLTFERGLLSAQTETRAGIRLERLPFEKLEEWRDWDTAQTGAPLALLATGRLLYDPTGNFGRIQRMLLNLGPERQALYRQELLAQAQIRLDEARDLLEQNRAILAEARSESAQILAEARKVADAQIQRAKDEAEVERQRQPPDDVGVGLAVGLGVDVGRLPGELRDVVVEAEVAGAVVLPQQLALAGEGLPQVGVGVLHEGCVEGLVLQLDDPYVLDRRRREGAAGGRRRVARDQGHGQQAGGDEGRDPASHDSARKSQRAAGRAAPRGVSSSSP